MSTREGTPIETIYIGRINTRMGTCESRKDRQNKNREVAIEGRDTQLDAKTDSDGGSVLFSYSFLFSGPLCIPKHGVVSLWNHISHAGGNLSRHSSQKVLCVAANLGEPYIWRSLSVGVCDCTRAIGCGAGGLLETSTPLDLVSEWPSRVSGERMLRSACFNAFASGNPPFSTRSHTRTQSPAAHGFTYTLKVPGV